MDKLERGILYKKSLQVKLTEGFFIKVKCSS